MAGNGIPLASNFNLSSPLPLDSRLQAENLTERNAIPSGNRFEGMTVYVKSEKKTYSLKGGIENSNFKEIVTEETTQALNAEIDQLKQSGVVVSDATTTTKGIVQLNNTLTSTSTTQASTPAQAKILNDNLTSHISDTTKKHIEIVDEIPTNLQGKGIFFEKQGGVSNAPNKPELQEIPSYWENHIESKINRIRQLQDEDGINRLSVGFITDMHLEGNNEKHSGSLMNKIDEELVLSMIINGGDCVSHINGAIPKANALSQIREMFKMFSPRVVDKMLYTVANHDDNAHSNQNWSNTLKEGELYSQFFRHLDNKVVRGESPRYYYIDNEFHKTRFIVLDCNDVPYIQENNRAKYPISTYHVFRQTQLEWFANVALNVPNNGWSVIVVCHAPPFRDGVRGFDRAIRNAEIPLGILAAFRNKTTYTGTSSPSIEADFKVTVSADFRGKGGEVICWLAGDTHQDNVATMTPYANIKLITTINDHKNRLSGAPQGQAGTISEQAFDILTIDKANKRVYLTRVGAGSDREFSYAHTSGGTEPGGSEPGGSEPGGEVVEGTLIFEDNFNRADSTTLGENWTLERGQVGISNNTAKPTSAGATTSIVFYNANVPQNNIRIESTFAHPGGMNGIGFAFRYQDDLNYIRLSMEYDTMILVIVENDVKTTIGSMNFNYIVGQRYNVRVDLVGAQIRVYINGNLALTGVSNKYLNTTKCGIRAWAGNNSVGTYYNFYVRNIVGSEQGTGGGSESVLLFEDNFTRPNSPNLGGNWIQEKGQFRIENNTAKPLLGNEVSSISLYAADVPQDNISVECTIKQNDGVGLVVRYIDEDNYLRISMEIEKIFLELVENDVKTILATTNYYYNATDTYDIRADIRGTEIKVYVNNALQLTVNSSKFLDTTKCGIRAWSAGNNNGTYYSFKVKEIINQ